MTGIDDTAPARADIDVTGMIGFVRDLVRIRSVHDPDGGSDESVAAALVAEKIRQFGWEPEVVEVAPGRPNVFATIEGGGGDGPTLAFEGHTDVVTEGALAEWTVEPYAAEMRDGKIYGRGSADMKSGVAAMLYASAAVAASGPFPGRIKLCVLVDEEGMMLGAKHACASGAMADIDGVICCEPEDGEICPVSKGALRLRVDVTGKMAHGAMPQHGRNPLPAVGRLLVAAADLESSLQREHPAHEHLGEVCLTPTVVTAGTPVQMNVIGGQASVYFDIRTIPSVNHAAVVERMRTLARQACTDGINAAVSIIDDRPPVDTPVDHPVVASLAMAHEEVSGSPARYGGVPGTTDGTILTRDAGLATVVYGPGGKWIAHQADEFVEVADLVRCARVYASTAHHFLSGNRR